MSSARHPYSYSIQGSVRKFFKREFHALEGIPGPDETWTTVDVPDPVASRVRTMSEMGIIERVDHDHNRTVWTMPRRHWTVLQEIQERYEVLDCGHRPFSNVDLESAKPYSCIVDDCDARYTREEIEGVLDR